MVRFDWLKMALKQTKKHSYYIKNEKLRNPSSFPRKLGLISRR
jgi:hypothetical protein